MNKLNKELLERALAEGVDMEESAESFVYLATDSNKKYTGFHLSCRQDNDRWQYACTEEEYLAAKAGKETVSDTKIEYDIGCYYEFSDCEDYENLIIGVLASVGRYKGNEYPFECEGVESYKYIRPLTAKAGEIRKLKPLSGFVNVYNDRCHPSPIHDTKGIADEYCNPEARLACIDLSQFNEGEGL